MIAEKENVLVFTGSVLLGSFIIFFIFLFIESIIKSESLIKSRKQAKNKTQKKEHYVEFYKNSFEVYNEANRPILTSHNRKILILDSQNFSLTHQLNFNSATKENTIVRKISQFPCLETEIIFQVDTDVFKRIDFLKFSNCTTSDIYVNIYRYKLMRTIKTAMDIVLTENDIAQMNISFLENLMLNAFVEQIDLSKKLSFKNKEPDHEIALLEIFRPYKVSLKSMILENKTK